MSVNPGQHGTGTEQPPVGTTHPPGNEEMPLILSHGEMNTAIEHGTAFPVTSATGWLMRYRDSWWVIYEDGWLRLITSTVTDRLDRLYPRLAEAEAQAAAEAARNRTHGRNRRRDEG